MPNQWVATSDVRAGDRLACLLSDAQAYPTVTGWVDQVLSNVPGQPVHRRFTVKGDRPWWVQTDPGMTTGSLGTGTLDQVLIVARCGCGHPPAEHPGPVGTGYATLPGGGTMCYGCNDKAEAARFATATVFTGFVNERDRTFTTWTAGKLATITRLDIGPWRTTPTGGRWRARHVKATAPDGSLWSGFSSNDTDTITLRKIKP